MQIRKYVFVILAIAFVACSRGNILPTTETTTVSKVLTDNPCDYIAKEQPEKTAFKGMELYSWQKPENGDWVFSILYGTNRNKMVWEVESFAMDLAEVGKCFCNMSDNENVFWLISAYDETADEYRTFLSPPDSFVEDVVNRANFCGVEINTYWVE